eukprot:Hpha_TRINITY_DN15152_c1_g1::TRINITY_DN15152_c1_g1_i1::g.127216::m.127216
MLGGRVRSRPEYGTATVPPEATKAPVTYQSGGLAEPVGLVFGHEHSPGRMHPGAGAEGASRWGPARTTSEWSGAQAPPGFSAVGSHAGAGGVPCAQDLDTQQVGYTAEALQPAPPSAAAPQPPRRPSAGQLQQEEPTDPAARRRQQQLQYKRELDAQIAARRESQARDAHPSGVHAAAGEREREAVSERARQQQKQAEYRRELEWQIREKEAKRSNANEHLPASRQNTPRGDVDPEVTQRLQKVERQEAYRRELDAQRAAQERARQEERERRQGSGLSAQGPKPIAPAAADTEALPQPGLPPTSNQTWFASQQAPPATQHLPFAAAPAPLPWEAAPPPPPQANFPPHFPPGGGVASALDPGAVGILPQPVEGQNSPTTAEQRWQQQQVYSSALQHQQEEQRRVRQEELDRFRERLPTPRENATPSAGTSVPPAMRDTLHTTDIERRQEQRRKQEEFRRQLDEQTAQRKQHQQPNPDPASRRRSQTPGEAPPPPPEGGDRSAPPQAAPGHMRKGRFIAGRYVAADDSRLEEEERKREVERERYREELAQQIAAKAERTAAEKARKMREDEELERRWEAQRQSEQPQQQKQQQPPTPVAPP